MTIKRLITISSLILISYACLLIKGALPVFLKAFGLDNADAVIFTLSQNIGGSQNYIFNMINFVLKESLITLFEYLGCICLISVSIFLMQLLLKRTLSMKDKRFLKHFFCTCLILLWIVSGYLVASCAVSIWKEVPVKKYIQAYGEFLRPQKSSAFYSKEFVPVENNLVEFLDKKNLVVIILESMEIGFQDSINGGKLSENRIPEITNLMKKNISFSPGGITVSGTGWTIGEVVAKTCAVPLFLPPEMNNAEGIKKFLPGIKCLTDVLKDNGYALAFAQGSFKMFASMNYFLKQHGNPKFYDLTYYQREKLIDFNNVKFWGISDGLLYEQVKKHIADLNSTDSAWAMFLMTIDTHSPYGRLDSLCPLASVNISEKEQYPYVLRCASMELNSFMEWAGQQSWYDSTVFVVMGDHATMASSDIVGYPTRTEDNLWLNFFVNAQKNPPSISRKFTSFDMFPTIIDAMGGHIKGNRLGFGVSLFSNDSTLLEIYGLDSLNDALKERGIEYNAFWNEK